MLKCHNEIGTGKAGEDSCQGKTPKSKEAKTVKGCLSRTTSKEEGGELGGGLTRKQGSHSGKERQAEKI